MADVLPLDRSRPLRGRDLRHAGLFVLHQWGSSSIREVLERLGNAGFVVGGEQPNKVVSDALRHEVRRGRLRRVGWGRYGVRRLAPTTLWRIRLRWNQSGPGQVDETAETGRAKPKARRRGDSVGIYLGGHRWIAGRERIRRYFNGLHVQQAAPEHRRRLVRPILHRSRPQGGRVLRGAR